MAVFLGRTGSIRLRRGSSRITSNFSEQIRPDDVTVSLARLGFSRTADNLITGDRVEITTPDARGLICFATSNWTNNTVGRSITAFVNVNPAGGLRFFTTFENAVNNVRAAEFPLATFTGDPIRITVAIRDLNYQALGNVVSYELNTSRDAVDTTTLNDKFRSQFTAGLISGSGRLDCLFDSRSTGLQEVPVFMLQILQRVDVGAVCDLILYVVDRSLDPSQTSVYYDFTAMITACGISVEAQNVINCTIDFVTTGEIKLAVGEPPGTPLNGLLLQQGGNLLASAAD